MSVNNRIFLGEGKHKIKNKAQRVECHEANSKLKTF